MKQFDKWFQVCSVLPFIRLPQAGPERASSSCAGKRKCHVQVPAAAEIAPPADDWRTGAWHVSKEAGSCLLQSGRLATRLPAPQESCQGTLQGSCSEMMCKSCCVSCAVLWQEAVDAKVLEEPNQMAIASADAQGVPSVRMVLLKGYDERGFMFYSNYSSRKAQELANGHAALCMYWEPLQRQVSLPSLLGMLSSVTADNFLL